MDHHWCFPVKSQSVCLKLSGVETHGFPLHQAVEIVSQVGPKHVITLPVEAFWCLWIDLAPSLVQNTSQFSTRTGDVLTQVTEDFSGRAGFFGFQVSYPQPLFGHLKLLTNSRVTMSPAASNLQPARSSQQRPKICWLGPSAIPVSPVVYSCSSQTSWANPKIWISADIMTSIGLDSNNSTLWLNTLPCFVTMLNMAESCWRHDRFRVGDVQASTRHES